MSCAIIGGSTLAAHCAQHLHRCGHEVKWVLSRGNPRLETLARSRSIPMLPDISAAHSPTLLVDYLFSIGSDLILDPRALRIAHRLSINYHNAPLPDYAGAFATSWAILNEEPAHGITWHVMVPQIDAGDILVQRRFAILESDDAESLNRRCQKEGLSGFETLISLLETDALQRLPQDLRKRRYFPVAKRPPFLGLLRWHAEARDLERQVRALHRGAIDNSFELARAVHRDEVFVVPRLRVLTGVSTQPAGTLIAIGRTEITIATATAPVAIGDLVSTDGRIQSAADWARRAGLGVGDPLPCVDDAFIEHLSRVRRDTIAHEDFCISAWAASARASARLPLAPVGVAACGPEQALPSCRTAGAAEDAVLIDTALLLAALALVLADGAARAEVAILLSTQRMRRQIVGAESFFAARLPVPIEVQESDSTRELLDRCIAGVESAEARGVHAKDLRLRRGVAIDAMDCPIELHVYHDRRAAAVATAPLSVEHCTTTRTFRLRSTPHRTFGCFPSRELRNLTTRIVELCSVLAEQSLLKS